jgi:hypothetical protein
MKLKLPDDCEECGKYPKASSHIHSPGAFDVMYSFGTGLKNSVLASDSGPFSKKSRSFSPFSIPQAPFLFA